MCAEALTNTAKHAAAARGSGLRGLTDRVETTGGTLQVDSVPGRGTRLAADIPLGGQAR